MVSHNPQWLEHSNSGRAQYQGSVGEDRERLASDQGVFLRLQQQRVLVIHRLSVLKIELN